MAQVKIYTANGLMPWARVYAQRFHPGGVRVGTEFRVNTTTFNDQIEPSVAPLGNGSYVVAWRLFSAGTSGIYGQRFGP
jgi:hypothetical protein